MRVYNVKLRVPKAGKIWGRVASAAVAAYQVKRSVLDHDGLYVEYTFHREGRRNDHLLLQGASWLIFDFAKVRKQSRLSKGTLLDAFSSGCRLWS